MPARIQPSRGTREARQVETIEGPITDTTRDWDWQSLRMSWVVDLKGSMGKFGSFIHGVGVQENNSMHRGIFCSNPTWQLVVSF